LAVSSIVQLVDDLPQGTTYDEALAMAAKASRGQLATMGVI
jgi:hypothetical protein